jgi:hypothetical protein
VYYQLKLAILNLQIDHEKTLFSIRFGRSSQSIQGRSSCPTNHLNANS